MKRDLAADPLGKDALERIGRAIERKVLLYFNLELSFINHLGSYLFTPSQRAISIKNVRMGPGI